MPKMPEKNIRMREHYNDTVDVCDFCENYKDMADDWSDCNYMCTADHPNKISSLECDQFKDVADPPKILLVIDLQEAFRHEPEYTRCQKFIEDHRKDYNNVIRTVFANPKGYRETNKNYEKYLGYTEEAMTAEDTKKAILTPGVIVKTGYGFPGNISDIKSSSYLPVDAFYDVIGCDTDACVMAVCFQLWDKGYDFRVLTDYCYTTGGHIVQEAAVRLMK